MSLTCLQPFVHRPLRPLTLGSEGHYILQDEFAEGVAVGSKFAVDVNTEATACVVTRAVLVPEDGEVVPMIEHIVKAEVIPFILRKQWIDLNGVVLTGA